jgi:uncharacterized protein YuzE
MSDDNRWTLTAITFSVETGEYLLKGERSRTPYDPETAYGKGVTFADALKDWQEDVTERAGTQPLHYDEAGDVLYLKLEHAKIHASAPLPDDGSVLLERNQTGQIVGLQLMCAKEMTQERWRKFYRTCDMPWWMYITVDNWLERAP